MAADTIMEGLQQIAEFAEKHPEEILIIMWVKWKMNTAVLVDLQPFQRRGQILTSIDVRFWRL